MIDGEPWFIAANVCKALGHDTTNGVYMFTKRLAQDEKQIVDRKNTPNLFRGKVGASKLTLIA